jgi:hypothetical protein
MTGIPTIIKEITDDDATIAMVDANVQPYNHKTIPDTIY